MYERVINIYIDHDLSTVYSLSRPVAVLAARMLARGGGSSCVCLSVCLVSRVSVRKCGPGVEVAHTFLSVYETLSPARAVVSVCTLSLHTRVFQLYTKALITGYSIVLPS
jgi:hypothetical protein